MKDFFSLSKSRSILFVLVFRRKKKLAYHLRLVPMQNATRKAFQERRNDEEKKTSTDSNHSEWGDRTCIKSALVPRDSGGKTTIESQSNSTWPRSRRAWH